MISREYRFHGRNSLNFVYTKGQTVRSQTLALKYMFNPKRKNFRVAAVVSRKVNKSAVVRNRIRRRIYTIVARHKDLIGSYDLVFSVYNDQLADITLDKLENLVIDLLTRSKVLKPVS